MYRDVLEGQDTRGDHVDDVAPEAGKVCAPAEPASTAVVTPLARQARIGFDAVVRDAPEQVRVQIDQARRDDAALRLDDMARALAGDRWLDRRDGHAACTATSRTIVQAARWIDDRAACDHQVVHALPSCYGSSQECSARLPRSARFRCYRHSA